MDPELNRNTSGTHTLRSSSLWLTGSRGLAAGSPPILAAGLVLHSEILLPVFGKEEGMHALLCHCSCHLEAAEILREPEETAFLGLKETD